MKELFVHSFTSGWGDQHYITVYDEQIIYEIINWGDVDFVKSSWEKLEYSHRIFLTVFKDDERVSPVIEFMKQQKLIE